MTIKNVMMTFALLCISASAGHAGYKVYSVKLSQETDEAFRSMELCINLDVNIASVSRINEVIAEWERTSYTLTDHLDELLEEANRGSESSNTIFNNWVGEHNSKYKYLSDKCVENWSRIKEFYN